MCIIIIFTMKINYCYSRDYLCFGINQIIQFLVLQPLFNIFSSICFVLLYYYFCMSPIRPQKNTLQQSIGLHFFVLTPASFSLLNLPLIRPNRSDLLVISPFTIFPTTKSNSLISLSQFRSHTLILIKLNNLLFV